MNNESTLEFVHAFIQRVWEHDSKMEVTISSNDTTIALRIGKYTDAKWINIAKRVPLGETRLSIGELAKLYGDDMIKDLYEYKSKNL